MRKGPLPPRTLASPLRLTDDIAARGETYPGMASWASETPGRTCRECNYWNHQGYLANGVIKKAQCMKARALMQDSRLPAIPHFAKACKYFDEAKEPPEPFKEA